ncbi:MAG TPA: YopX family protein [Candidatus Paceibacterota bacterium]
MARTIKFRGWDETHKTMLQLTELRLPQTEPCLMQYIGLQDKNGKEIFEGDILHTDFTRDDGLAENFVVEYEPATGFIGGKTHGQNPSTCCTVIGNIYQNPNLLSPKQ